MVAQSGAVAGRRGEHGRGLTSKLILLFEAAGCPTSSQTSPVERLPPGRHTREKRDSRTFRHTRGECHGGVRIRGGHRGPRDRRDGVVAVGGGALRMFSRHGRNRNGRIQGIERW